MKKAGVVLILAVFGGGWLWPQPNVKAYAGGFLEAVRTGDAATVGSALRENPGLAFVPDDRGRLPLHAAVVAGQAEVVHTLLLNGANPNSPLPDGRTALFLADTPDIVTSLLSHGADPFVRDSRGRTAMERIVNIALLLVDQRPGKNALLTAYLDAGISFPAGNEAGRFFLHGACRIGHDAFVEHLVANGVDLTSMNDAGGSVLHSAASGGLERQTRKFLTTGFEVNARDRYGLTPLSLAAMEGHAGVVALLLEGGADPSLETPAGKNAADCAAEFGHGAIARLLTDAGAGPSGIAATGFGGPYFGLEEPGDIPRLFAPGLVSTIHYEHSAPLFSRDGREVYWAATYTSRGDHIYSMKLENNRWSAPRIEPFCRIGGTYMYPVLSPGGDRLFFTSDHAVPGGEPGREMNIWYVERRPGGWSEPHPVGFPDGDEYGLSMADNGTLYFMADYDGGAGSSDLYRSRLVDGRYEQPENLGAPINSPYYEDEPFIAPDESYLLFASLKPQPAGRGRLYISVKEADGSWGAPANISSRIKMDGDLRFPRISTDGRFLFFAGNRNGNWDIYWVDKSILSAFF